MVIPCAMLPPQKVEQPEMEVKQNRHDDDDDQWMMMMMMMFSLKFGDASGGQVERYRTHVARLLVMLGTGHSARPRPSQRGATPWLQDQPRIRPALLCPLVGQQ